MPKKQQKKSEERKSKSITIDESSIPTKNKIKKNNEENENLNKPNNNIKNSNYNTNSNVKPKLNQNNQEFMSKKPIKISESSRVKPKKIQPIQPPFNLREPLEQKFAKTQYNFNSNIRLLSGKEENTIGNSLANSQIKLNQQSCLLYLKHSGNYSGYNGFNYSSLNKSKKKENSKIREITKFSNDINTNQIYENNEKKHQENRDEKIHIPSFKQKINYNKNENLDGKIRDMKNETHNPNKTANTTGNSKFYSPQKIQLGFPMKGNNYYENNNFYGGYQLGNSCSNTYSTNHYLNNDKNDKKRVKSNGKLSAKKESLLNL